MNCIKLTCAKQSARTLSLPTLFYYLCSLVTSTGSDQLIQPVVRFSMTLSNILDSQKDLLLFCQIPVCCSVIIRSKGINLHLIYVSTVSYSFLKLIVSIMSCMFFSAVYLLLQSFSLFQPVNQFPFESLTSRT